MSVQSIDAKRAEKRMGSIRLPRNPQLERALLGLILSWPDQLGVVLEYADADDFTVAAHRRVFEAMCDIAFENKTIDVPLVCERLGPDEPGNEWGGTAMLAEAMSMDIAQSNAAAYAEHLRALTVRRGAIALGTRLAAEAAENPHPQELLLSHQADVDELTQKFTRTATDGSLKPVAERIANEIENPGATIHPVPMGLKEIDMRVRMVAGSVTIVAAITSVGKTMLAVNMARYASGKRGFRGLYATLEVSSGLIVERLLSGLVFVPYENLRPRALTEGQRNLTLQGLAEISGWPLRVIDNAYLTPATLRIQIKAAKKALGGLDYAVVDYLQLVSANPGRKYSNREQEIATISRQLHTLAGEEQIAIVALSQLNRTGYSGRPRLEHLRESGAIENDADVVLFLYREPTGEDGGYTSDPGDTEIIIAKNRDGARGMTVIAHQDPRLQRFDDSLTAITQ